MKLFYNQFAFAFLMLLLTVNSFAQTIISNTSEEKVPPYTLPDPLVDKAGKKITTATEWNNQQRPYIYHLFEENVYGKFPLKKIPLQFVVRETNAHALNNLAIRKQVRIYFDPPTNNVYLDLL